MNIAVIKTGGKQYLVKPNQQLKIEKIKGDKGKKVTFKNVLLVADDKAKKVEIGQPTVKDQVVEAEIIEQGRARKVEVVKYKPKIRYKRVLGHRQAYTKVKITSIGKGSAKVAAKPKSVTKKAPAKKAPAKTTKTKKITK